jgi:phosphatidylinositol glycan class V
MTDVWTAVRHGLLSRCAACLLFIVGDALLPDHTPSGVDFAPVQVPAILNAFTRWDAAHFLRLTKQGYAQDKDYAFFPLLPLLARHAAPPLSALTRLSLDACLVLSGVLISNLAFVAACVAVHTFLSSRKGLSEETKRIALLFFCYNPASVFFSAIYTESLYSMLAFPAVALASTSLSMLGSVSVVVLSFLSGFARSNGFLNAVFPAVRAGRALLLVMLLRQRVTLRLLAGIGWDLLTCVLLFVPYLWQNTAGYVQFCVPNESEGNPDGFVAPAWCTEGLFPSVYSHVQLKYWNVGFLRYYQLKQIPNLALAAPILFIAGSTIFRRIRSMLLDVPATKKKEDDDGDHDRTATPKQLSLQTRLLHVLNHPDLADVCHLLILTVVAILVVNIQISTRLLISSSPLISLGFAELWCTSSPSLKTALRSYVGVYFVLGTLLHANFFPWT